jgi:alkanesulfonate monooxygenase SsuD/methylene tetrahydromethanopterin reductase-like flavin-dependent oxidoreductase (luciferase family)
LTGATRRFTGDRDVELGVHLPHLGQHVDPEQIAGYAPEAEALGRQSVWASAGWRRRRPSLVMPWDRRGRRADEQLWLFTSLFEEETPSFDGESYRLPEVRFQPKSVQPPLPIWVGGATSAAFSRTARHGHGFHAAFQTEAVLEQAWSEVGRACEAQGRDAAELDFSVRPLLDPQALMPGDAAITGCAQRMHERIRGLQRIGVTHVLLDPVARGGVVARLGAVRRFMEEVAPAFS